jgi:tetratricopeptide (TPR) repeat protein
LIVILKVYWLNLKTVFWPTELTVDYWNVTPEGPGNLQFVLGAVAAGLTVALLWALRKRKIALFGLVWFGLALAPTSQIMPHHIDRADRFLYLPLIGLAVGVAAGLRPPAHALKRQGPLLGILAAGTLLLVVTATLSARQVQTWRSSISLWEHCLRVHPGSLFAHQCLADALAEAKQFERAIPYYERALEMDPEDHKTLHNYAMRLATSAREELRDYERAIQLAWQGCRLTGWREEKLRRTLALAHMNYATDLKGKGQFEQAVAHYKSAIQADPDFERPLLNLALWMATCPDERFRRPGEAVRLADQAGKMMAEPDAVQLVILATIYAETERFDRAVEVAERGIQVARASGETAWVAEFQRRVEQYHQQARAQAVRP